MNNLLTNAGFLDQANGWTATPGGLTVTVDEGVRGRPGRMALRATGASTTAGQAFRLAPTAAGRADVTGLATIEVQVACAAFINGAPSTPVARLTFLNGSGGVILSYDMTVRPPVLSQWGVAQGGLLDTYHRAIGRFPTPGGAVRATLEVGGTATASGQSLEAVLVKPLIGAAPPMGHPLLWDPGLHVATDLQRPAWPGVLRVFEAGAGAEPKPWAIEFDAGSGLPMARRSAADPARKFSGRIRCDTFQRNLLEAFAASATKFWIVEPDSERLCVARFAADGAPRLTETRGALHFMDVILWLETA